MRGKGVRTVRAPADLGITPAYAGKRNRRERKLALLEDHPRLCGEKGCERMCIKSVMGSPPPMRGKVLSTGDSEKI